ncbi:GNAT family N-acetyltransferase [Marinomonas pollencensis]|uniref:RimJ/RimL family protein N-acetyltransferase n=1 Tax=Marinomonas pollencensis TaxID=491954 RepID=A0A3E0DPZ6_9GAMM|nr:GNAT family N-acetyltransferase [Marinomonas pollencensis]REG85000.1 RimJ/RimL family protein N-acetyltransferase [Marinomonas pollencensis]
MKTELQLRPANMNDADCLLAWRNDRATREASLCTARVEVADHIKWLRSAISNDQQRLYIAEVNHRAVGSIRADREGECWILSWTVAPRSRGKGIAQQMLKCFIEGCNETLLAQIKVNNIASQKVAVRAGFVLQDVQDGIFFYQRNAD